MAKVKIFLEPRETERDAENALLKALTLHNEGEVHTEKFADPAMQLIVDKLTKIHEELYEEMLNEINDALDAEYIKNGN